jgi:hypothetical protein
MVLRRGPFGRLRILCKKFYNRSLVVVTGAQERT